MTTISPQPRIPKIIHQIWFQGEDQIPHKYQAWRHSVIEHNPLFQYRLWSDNDLTQLLQNHYPHLVSFYHELPHMHMKIDMMKLVILHQHGGVYIDMDCEALRDFTPAIYEQLPEHCYEVRCPTSPSIILQRMFCLPGASDYAFLNNNFIAAQPGHWFLQNVISNGMNYVKSLPPYYHNEKYIRRIVLESFGPRRLTHCYHIYCEDSNDFTIINSGVFEFSEFEQHVGHFYGIAGIHNNPISQHYITHSYEVTWMTPSLQKRFKTAYKLLPRLLQYYYAPTSTTERVMGIPWFLINIAMSFIKWRRDLAGSLFIPCPYAKDIENRYSVYHTQTYTASSYE